LIERESPASEVSQQDDNSDNKADNVVNSLKVNSLNSLNSLNSQTSEENLKCASGSEGVLGQGKPENEGKISGIYFIKTLRLVAE
jgi:hypothetical protein